MKLHIQHLHSVEQSERVRQACLTYLQNWYFAFHPERPDMVAELRSIAAALGGEVNGPYLRKKFAWMIPLFGLERAKWAQMAVPQIKSQLIRRYDKTMFGLEERRGARGQLLAGTSAEQG